MERMWAKHGKRPVDPYTAVLAARISAEWARRRDADPLHYLKISASDYALRWSGAQYVWMTEVEIFEQAESAIWKRTERNEHRPRLTSCNVAAGNGATVPPQCCREVPHDPRQQQQGYRLPATQSAGWSDHSRTAGNSKRLP